MQQRRPGRPSKGDRVIAKAGLPVALYEIVKRQADAEGLPVMDLLARVISHAYGRPAPAYCYPRKTQRPAA